MNAREPVLTSEHILVVGVGGGGCNAVDSMCGQWENGPALAVINTDTQALDGARTPRRLAIGRKITSGMGTGGDAEVGRLASEDDVESLRELFEGIHLAFIVASLGGGTGTGAAPVVARAAQEAGALVIAFATLPFEFEGERRLSQAKQGLARLKDEADIVIVVPNQDLFAASGSSLSAEEAFHLSDYQLGMGVFAIWKLLVTRGVINLDFAALRMVARGSDDTSVFSYGEGKGPDRADDAVRAALSSPLVAGGQAVSEAECVIVSILGGPDLALREIETIMTAVHAATRKEAHLLMGAAIDLAWAGTVAVTLVVSRNWNTDANAIPTAKAGSGQIEAPLPKSTGRKGKKGGGATQQGLGLDGDISKGMFKDVEPTVIDGVDMDIPTFIRRRVTIEK